jgi:hypothetical protein
MSDRETKMENAADDSIRFSLLDMDDLPSAPSLPTELKEMIANGLAAFVSWAPAAGEIKEENACGAGVGNLVKWLSDLAASLPEAAPADEEFQPNQNFRATTALGAQMSPRMARCYGFLAKRGLALGSFSTDDAVAGCLPRLRAVIAEVEGANAKATSQVRQELLADLKAIAGRVPEARVAATGHQVDEVVAKPTPVQKAKSEVIAVGTADETTGAVAYWELSGQTYMDALRGNWAAQGLDEKLLTRGSSATTSRRSCPPSRRRPRRCPRRRAARTTSRSTDQGRAGLHGPALFSQGGGSWVMRSGGRRRRPRRS